MTPFRPSIFLMSSTVVSAGRTLEKTFMSLTLLEMRWVYWPPKSRTMMVSIR